MKSTITLVLALLFALSLLPVTAQDGEISLSVVGRYETGIIDEGAAEIAAYDVESQRLFVTNADASGIDVLDISDVTAPTLVTNIAIEEYGDGVNSVAIANGVVAAAVEAAEVGEAGLVLFMNADGEVLGTTEAGFLPDMITFTPDGTKVLVANEGEPNDDYSIDPVGSVTVVDISEGVENAVSTQLGFEAFNDAVPAGVRVFGPGATFAQDAEPEYIAVVPDGSAAYVVLQENNAIARVDLEAMAITVVAPLGFKDHSLEGNGFDASNEDGVINIQPWPTLGMYQPDAIAAFEIDGAGYLITANEGDARDYDGFSEEARVDDLTLDPEAFPNAVELQAEDQLGRLNTTTAFGDTDGDGDHDVIYSYGARSFTIWDAQGNIVFDSGDQLEQIVAELEPEGFNSQGLYESFDNRSDDKGPEPEGVTVGVVGENTYAFVGLERVGGVMVFNISDPAAPVFVQWANNTDWQGSFEEQTFTGDIAPEGVLFISAEDSPNGSPLLIVTNEVSGTTTIYEIAQ